MYRPGPPPADTNGLAAYCRAEFEKIARELLETTIRLKVLHVEPSKPRDGDVVLADGTDWNPGSGAGFYGRSSGAWVFLG